jgi:biopolymer transport protein ExbB
MNDLIVEITLYSLIALSIYTWSVAIKKYLLLRRKRVADELFLRQFEEASSIASFYQLNVSTPSDYGRLVACVASEFNELKSLNKVIHYGELREELEHTIKQELQNIARTQEKGLSEFATIGSASPFVGLFGTVWGIKTALVEIAKAGQAGLDVVAGPIGEALIATAIGIAVALPAVTFYNYFVRSFTLRITELENFMEIFIRRASKEISKGVS